MRKRCRRGSRGRAFLTIENNESVKHSVSADHDQHNQAIGPC